jgi:imidazolonepropionase-like amidohydrolase
VARSRSVISIVVGLLVVSLGPGAIAQEAPPRSATSTSTVAFVNVTVVAMDDEGLAPGQTVVVQGDRIAQVGLAADVPVPAGAMVIEGQGRYLVPGLTDAHVHLVGDGTGRGSSRPDFGDAPLYLTHGVTTVINLRGTPEQLDWRRRVETGRLDGPTIYTAGEFVDAPRVTTPEDVRREVIAQARDGYDLIKFHEVHARGIDRVTTSGLSLESYRELTAAARDAGLPLVGHAPVHLGLDALLDARQPLAHLGTLSNVYFLPMVANPGWLLATASALTGLIVIAVAGVIRAAFRIARSTRRPPKPVARVRLLVGMELLTTITAGVTAASVLPGGPLFESTSLRVLFTALVLVITAMTVVLMMLTTAIWREPETSRVTRVQAAAASLASVVLVCAALFFWVPVAWRSGDAGIQRLATRVRDAGISVQTTLVAYDALGGGGRPRLLNDPAMEFLRPDVRDRWRRMRQVAPREYRYTAFMQKVARVLHRTGVPLVAGTDAMGFPLITPGSSLHHELGLLAGSGLTPYEVLRAATVAPATFLGRHAEFGTITAGKRADLLLVEGNPLDDLARLRRPAGVMARGRWFTRSLLDGMVTALAQEP